MGFSLQKLDIIGYSCSLGIYVRSLILKTMSSDVLLEKNSPLTITNVQNVTILLKRIILCDQLAIGNCVFILKE
jgi:hypothetical protein